MDIDLRPPVSRIEVMQGDAIIFGPITIRLAGVPMNLTGATIRAQARRGSRSVEFTVTRGDDVSGVIAQIKATGAPVAAMQPGPWDWELEITDALGDPRTYARVTIEVTRDASRAA